MSWFISLLSTPILNVLLAFYHVFQDMGSAIVVLTSVIFVLTIPLTYRQLRHARTMRIKQRELQPEVDALRKMHANNPGAFIQAQQNLYKQHGIAFKISLVQIVTSLALLGLFLALNTVLQNGSLAALNTAIYPFMPHFVSFPNLGFTWFTFVAAGLRFSLSAPDPTHILPIFAGVITLVQMSLSVIQNHNVAHTKDTIQLTSFLLPLLITAITLFFTWQIAAGVALYRSTWLGLNMLLQTFVNGMPVKSGLVANTYGGARDIMDKQALITGGQQLSGKSRMTAKSFSKAKSRKKRNTNARKRTTRS
jgi:YidC/Oxa1 family membrane protein insertase